jgi:uncharacterized membrane protein YphA (DoxX/SURF4 family)
MILVLRLALAGVFLVAGVLKIWDIKVAGPFLWQLQFGGSATQDFTRAIQAYHLLPPDLAVLLAVYLPWLEVVAAVAVFVRRLALGASAAMLGMSVAFLGAITSAWWRGLDISCGCFGKEEISTDYRLHIIGNIALLAASTALFICETRRAATVAGSSTVSSTPAPAA